MNEQFIKPVNRQYKSYGDNAKYDALIAQLKEEIETLKTRMIQLESNQRVNRR